MNRMAVLALILLAVVAKHAAAQRSVIFYYTKEGSFFSAPSAAIKVSESRIHNYSIEAVKNVDDNVYPRALMRNYNESAKKRNLKTHGWFFLSSMLTKLVLLL